MKIFDCHSHWATPGHSNLRTDEDWQHAKTVFGADRFEMSDDEQATYFAQHQARAIMDLSYTKELPIDEMRADHDYAVAYEKRFPGVVAGHWLQFQPWRMQESLDEFARVDAASPGFVGFCVNGQTTGVAPSDSSWNPIYERSLELDRPVMILCGLTGIGQGHPGGKGIILDNGHPRHVDAVAARYPYLRVLAARPAYPWQDEMIAMLLHKSNVSYELHGWGPKHLSPALKREIGSRLQDRVMFGCDFPTLRFEYLVEAWRREGYSDEVLAKLFHINAEQYFESS